MEKDSRGNYFVEIDNIRMTYIKSVNRKPEKDWPEIDVVRIQAYRESGSSSLHMGAEIPITNSETILELIKGLIQLYQENKG